MTENEGFQIKDRRVSKLIPAEIRQQLLSQTLQVLINETSNLPDGYQSKSLDLKLHHQQTPITCLLACAISVAEAIKKKNVNSINYNELILKSQLDDLGLINQYGLDTFPEKRQETINFLQKELDLKIVDITSREPADMAKELARNLIEMNIVLVNSAAHWVVLYGLEKVNSNDAFWLVMNPAFSELEKITTPQLANRLVGDPTFAPPDYPGLGVKADLLYVQLPKNLTIKAIRRQTPANFKIKEIRSSS